MHADKTCLKFKMYQRKPHFEIIVLRDNVFVNFIDY